MQFFLSISIGCRCYYKRLTTINPGTNEHQRIWNGILRIRPLIPGYESGACVYGTLCVVSICVVCATVSFELRSKTDCLSKWIGANPFDSDTQAHNVCTFYVYVVVIYILLMLLLFFFLFALHLVSVCREWERMNTEKAAIRGASRTNSERTTMHYGTEMKNENMNGKLWTDMVP